MGYKVSILVPSPSMLISVPLCIPRPLLLRIILTLLRYKACHRLISSKLRVLKPRTELGKRSRNKEGQTPSEKRPKH